MNFNALGPHGKQIAAAGGIGAIALLALYAKNKSASGTLDGATTTTTAGTGATSDTTATDLAQYVDQQVGGTQLQIGNLDTSLEALQGQVDAQGNRLAWAGGQLSHDTGVIASLRKQVAAKK